MYDKYKEKQAAYDRYYKKQLEDRKRLSERTEEIQKILDIGQEYISKIHDSNVIIKDKVITRKLYKRVSLATLELLSVARETAHLPLFVKTFL